MIKTPLSTVIGGAFWTPGATVIGGNTPTFDQQIQKLFANGEQGFFYDPNDLTAEKINWRKNLLLNTEDFVALSSSGFSAVKHTEGWLLNALTSHIGGWSLGALYPIGSNTANVGSGTIVRSIEFKKGTANEIRLGAAADGVAILINVNTMAVTRNSGNLPYTITPLSDGWYRLETWHYSPLFATSQLSHMFGWAMSRTSSGFDAEGQVGSTVYARNPSFAFVPYETTQSIPYQAISDFNSDFTRAFPSHTLYQDAAGTVPVTAAGQPAGLMKDKSGRNNHAYQTTSAARPILQDAPRRIDFDISDDKLITNLQAQLTGCTVVRSVPGVGVQLLTNQTIPATYEDNTDHCGLIVINRALTPSETSAIAAEFNKRAGV